MEGQHHDVDPCDLGNGNRIGNGERSLQNTVHTSEDFVELDNAGNGLVLVQSNLEGFIVDDAVDVGGEVVEDFKRQVTKGLLGALDPLAGVGLGKCNTKVFSNGLDLLLVRGGRDINFGSTGKSVEVLNTFAEIGVVDTGLESKPVLDGAGKCIEQVDGRKLIQQILLAKVAFTLCGVDPDSPRQVLADKHELTPVLATFGVALIGRACSEGDGQTDDKTKNSQKQTADNQRVDELGNAGNGSGPDRDYNQRQYHLRKDGTVHSHKIWPFAVFRHVARSDLVTSVSIAAHDRVLECGSYKVILGVKAAGSLAPRGDLVRDGSVPPRPW